MVSQPDGTVVTIDRASATLTIRLPNGMQTTLPWESDRFEESSAIARMRFEVGGTLLQLETLQGDKVSVELPHPDSLAPINGRPVVYLDQNHWSTLAWTIHRPEVVPPAERESAERIISLAERRQLILPMSSGHMAETCQWTDNQRRYQLALTILQLSGGWQMRDPLSLWNAELRSALLAHVGGRAPAPQPAFTLEPNVLLAGRTARNARGTGLLPSLAFAATVLSSASSIFDVMLNGEPVRRIPVPGWAHNLQSFTDWLAGEPRSERLSRERTRVVFLRDMSPELARAAEQARLSTAQLGDWFNGCTDSVIGQLRSLGIYRELLHEKLVDPRTQWEGNDLVDMMYLSCAAAYANFVVAERRLSGDLQNALRRLGRPTNIYRNLRDLAVGLGEGVGT